MISQIILSPEADLVLAGTYRKLDPTNQISELMSAGPLLVGARMPFQPSYQPPLFILLASRRPRIGPQHVLLRVRLGKPNPGLQ